MKAAFKPCPMPKVGVGHGALAIDIFGWLDVSGERRSCAVQLRGSAHEGFYCQGFG
jgi:hypothetical protein